MNRRPTGAAQAASDAVKEAARRVLQPASPPRRRAPAAQAPQDVGRPGPPAPAAQPQGAWALHKSRRALWREAAVPAAPHQPGDSAALCRPPPGFTNPGHQNHCVVNATVQLLAAVPGFASGLEALRGDVQAVLQARACAAWDPLWPCTWLCSAGGGMRGSPAMRACKP